MDEKALAIRDIENLKGRVTWAAESLVNKLNKEIEKGHDTRAFMIALIIAAFKDFLDVILTFLAIELAPGVALLLTLFLDTFLILFIVGKGWFLKTKIRFARWFLGLFIESLPVFSVLPINTLMVLSAWRIVRKRAARAKEKKAKIHTMTQKEITELDTDIGLLELESANQK